MTKHIIALYIVNILLGISLILTNLSLMDFKEIQIDFDTYQIEVNKKVSGHLTYLDLQKIDGWGNEDLLTNP